MGGRGRRQRGGGARLKGLGVVAFTAKVVMSGLHFPKGRGCALARNGASWAREERLYDVVAPLRSR